MIGNLKLEMDANALGGSLIVAPVRDTSLMSVSLEDENPALAAQLVNQVCNVFIKQLNEQQHSRYASSEENLSKELEQIQGQIEATQKALDQAHAATPPSTDEVSRLQTMLSQYQNSYATLLNSYEDLRVAEARTSNSVSLVEPATVPAAPINSRTFTNTLLAAVVGAMLAVGLAFLIDYLDDTVKSPDDVREAFDLTTMGVIGRFEPKTNEPKTAMPVTSAPRSPTAEAFRSLRTNIQFASIDKQIRTLLITSASPGEGKTTIALNLAASLAQAGQSVALLDCDLRRPSIHRWLGMPNSMGLSNAALQAGKLNGNLQSTAIENLKALTSGPLPPNPSELLGSERVARILEELKQQADIVIIDSPPTLVVTDPAVLAKRVDAVLLVVETGATRRDTVEQALESLQQVGANVVGVVLNKLSVKRGGHYRYQYYHYYYHYSAKGEKVKGKEKHNGSNGKSNGIAGQASRSNGQGQEEMAKESK